MGKYVTTETPLASVAGININRSKPAHWSNYDDYSGRTVNYICYHYTGNYEDSAAGNANYFMGSDREASAHYFVDDDTIYQSVDANDMAWHCGGGRNHDSIGIEMCCTAGNYRIGEQAITNAIALGVELCKFLNITADMVDTYIIRHYDVTGKNCPAQFAGRNNSDWQAFKNRIKEGLTPKKTGFVVGDTVSFVGNKHYASSNAASGSTCAPGEAKITAIADGARHPYHLVRTPDGGSTVYGWVNIVDVKEFEVETVAVRVGDVVDFTGGKHYKSANAAIGSNCNPGAAKVTAISNGAKHPYHLVKTENSGATVYGWVNAADIKVMVPEKPVVVDTTIDSVEEVQAWLNSKYNAGLDVDGGYGPLTKAALIKVLQRGLGVDVDGGYGPQTHGAVYSMYLGDSGMEVEALQGLLVCHGYTSAYVDGGFGNDTKSAVLAYQRDHHLRVDGYAGQETFASLCDY